MLPLLWKYTCAAYKMQKIYDTNHIIKQLLYT